MSPTERRSILLVDDSDAELELMKYYLEPWQGVFNLKSASDKPRPSTSPVHAAVCMAALPHRDRQHDAGDGRDRGGCSVCAMQPQPRSVPIVMWSGSANPDDVRRAYENGVTSYLVKPTGAERTREALQLAVRYWVELHIPQAAAV